MSCLPSYAYQPTFTASGTTCTIPVYNKHRARLFAGGTYFRSIFQSSDWNNITLSIHTSAGNHILTVSHPDYPTETFSIQQAASIDGILPCTPGIAEMRTAVNHPTTGSDIIEMPVRGSDVQFDAGGVDSLCLSTFTVTNMMGGSGAPTDGASLATIRTGPSRSIIALQTMEDIDGTPITPPESERTQQWNGTGWVEYSNSVPGNCPI